MNLFDMTCCTCKTPFNYLVASCGTGYSWNLYRCPHCGQLQAKAENGGYIPQAIYDDPEVKTIESSKAVRF